MGRRRTSRFRAARPQQQVEIRVTSPRIVGFGLLRLIRAGVKLALVAGLLAGAGWGAMEGLQAFFMENEEFRLREIELETDGRITETHVAELAGLDPRASVFAFNLAEIRERIEARPGVVRAGVSRRLPGTLRIRVEERVPVAWIECRPLGAAGRDPENGLLLDAEGVCFRCDPWWAEKARELPVIMLNEGHDGELGGGRPLRCREGRRALHLVLLSEELLAEEEWGLEVVAVRNEYSLLAATSEGTWVTFGMYDHERQLRDLLVLRRHLLQTDRVLAAANLIPERNTPARFVAKGAARKQLMWLAPDTRLERDISLMAGGG